ncbi:hypothetical protein CR513_34843, partial [Mucuna pruriens]
MNMMDVSCLMIGVKYLKIPKWVWAINNQRGYLTIHVSFSPAPQCWLVCDQNSWLRKQRGWF